MQEEFNPLIFPLELENPEDLPDDLEYEGPATFRHGGGKTPLPWHMPR